MVLSVPPAPEELSFTSGSLFGVQSTSFLQSKRAPRGWVGNPLLQALVWPHSGEVGHVLPQDATQVRLAQDEEMIQALAPDTAEEPRTYGGLPGGAVGRAQLLDVGPRGEPGEGRPVLAARSRMRCLGLSWLLSPSASYSWHSR